MTPFSRFLPFAPFKLVTFSIFLLPVAAIAAPPIATFGGAVTVTNPFGGPQQIAVDSHGNVFAAIGNSTLVYEIMAVNGLISPTSPIKSVGSGFTYPYGVAVDANGNVFVADGHNSAVKEIVAVNGQVSSTSTVISLGTGGGFAYPYGVAVDAKGNVFVADTNNNAVKKIVAVNGQVSPTSTVITVGSGFNMPWNVAVDASGNVFVSDWMNAAVKEIVAVNGEVTSTSTVKTVGSGFSSPDGLAVDANGNVYVGDYWGTAVKEIVAVNGQVSSTSTVKTLASGFRAIGVAVWNNDTLYVVDGSLGSLKMIPLGVSNFGTVGVGASVTVQVPFTFNATGNAGSWKVYTQGATGLDFTEDPSSTTCSATTTYTAGQVCTVGVKFSPLHPGLRMGAVQLLDSGGALIATAPLKGIGTGPQVVFSSNTSPVAVSSSFRMPTHFAVDASGNVFVTDYATNVVSEIVAADGQVSAASTVKPIGSGFSGPIGIAVDGSGNVFVADFFNGVVKEIVAVNGQVSSSSTVKTVAGGAFGVAVDGSGNLYFSDWGSTVRQVVAVDGQVSLSSPVNTISSAFVRSTGLVVDANGNVFVADYGDNAIKEIVAVNGQVSPSSTVKTVGSGFSEPYAVAVDAAGNVFVADNGHDAIKEIVAVNGQVSSSSTVLDLGTFRIPQGVAVDASGNVIASTNITVEKIPLATPPSLVFPTATKAGMIDTTDNPQTFTVANNGNAPLAFALPTSGYNPSISSGFEWNNASTCQQTGASSLTAFALAPGPGCTVAINFAPRNAGAISGNVVLTDNSLNKSRATQSIAVSGTGLKATPSISWATPASIVYGTALGATQLSAAATGVGGNSVAGTFTYTPAAGTVLSAGTQSLSVTFTPTDTTNYTTASANVTIAVQDFTLPGASPTLTVAAGQSQNSTIAITPVAGWTGTVALACSVPATMAQASCSATSAQISGTAAVNSTLTVTTTGPHQVAELRFFDRGSATITLGMLFFGLFWFGVPRKSRRVWPLLVCAILLSQVFLLSGCGGGGGSSTSSTHTDPGTLAGTYALTVTASSGMLSHTMQVNVTVQ